MSKIYYLPIDKKFELPPRKILSDALEKSDTFTRVTIIGETKDGKHYHSSSSVDKALVNMDLDVLKHILLTNVLNETVD